MATAAKKMREGLRWCLEEAKAGVGLLDESDYKGAALSFEAIQETAEAALEARDE